WKGKAFDEAAEVFARLLAGETMSSDQVAQRSVERSDFRSDADWEKAAAAAQAEGTLAGDRILLPKRFVFEELKLVPQEFRRDLLQLVVGSHDPAVHALVNRFLPAHVANL